MFLSVIICTYNREKYIPGLLNSLYLQNIDKTKYEIIFIDNNSTDNTESICNVFKDTHVELKFGYFKESKQGLSHARNRGIQEASGDILIFIDDDTIVEESYLKGIVAFFSEHENIRAGGGKILPKYETSRPLWMSKFIEPVVSVIHLGDKIRPFPKNKFPIGANMFFGKEVFQQVGCFNPDLGRTAEKLLGGEEKDIFNRMKEINLNIYYVPDAIIYHIIPDERLGSGHIKKQAIGIGFSERIRAKSIGNNELIKSYFKELIKHVATLVLFLVYCIQFQFSKAKMIVFFRYRVSQGLFFGKHNLNF